MKKSSNLFAWILLLTFCFAAHQTTLLADAENRNVGNFDVLNVQGAMDVFITQSTAYEVRVEAPADKIDNVITEVKNDELVIQYKRKRGKGRRNGGWGWSNTNGIKIYVSVRHLEGLILSGSGDVEGGGLTAKDFKVRISGSGNIDIGVDAHYIDLSISGSGDLDIKGHTQDFDIQITGSGDIDAASLKSKHCKIGISGSGDCKVNASESLEVHISGSGNVSYKGNPSQVDQHISGSGDVVRR